MQVIFFGPFRPSLGHCKNKNLQVKARSHIHVGGGGDRSSARPGRK